MKSVGAISLLAGLLLAALLLGAVGCGNAGYTPMNTRAAEERYLGMGHSRKMYDYGEQLLAEGRYQEAHAAFLDAEQTAYTYEMRNAARKRRMWLEDSIKVMQGGGQRLPANPTLGQPPETASADQADAPPQAGQAGSVVLPGVKPGSEPIIVPGPQSAVAPAARPVVAKRTPETAVEEDD